MAFIKEDWSFLYAGEYTLLKYLYENIYIKQLDFKNLIKESNIIIKDLSKKSGIDSLYIERVIDLYYNNDLSVDLIMLNLAEIKNDKLIITDLGLNLSNFIFKSIPDYNSSTLLLSLIGKKKNLYAKKSYLGTIHFLAGIQGLNLDEMLYVACDLEKLGLIEKGFHDSNAITREYNINITSEGINFIENLLNKEPNNPFKFGVKQSILKKIDSILNSPIEKKMAYGSFVTGSGLVSVPIISQIFELKFSLNEYDVLISHGGNSDLIYWISLIIGVFFIGLSVYFLKKIPRI